MASWKALLLISPLELQVAAKYCAMKKSVYLIFSYSTLYVTTTYLICCLYYMFVVVLHLNGRIFLILVVWKLDLVAMLQVATILVAMARVKEKNCWLNVLNRLLPTDTVTSAVWRVAGVVLVSNTVLLWISLPYNCYHKFFCYSSTISSACLVYLFVLSVSHCLDLVISVLFDFFAHGITFLKTMFLCLFT